MAVTIGDISDNADAAARTAGVVVRELGTLAEIAAVRALLDDIWQPGDVTDPPIGTEIIRALTHAGNYLAGAFDGATLVGASVGFFGWPPGEVLHSHVTGVAAQARRRSIGFALKLHQADWARRRGISTITWTFDPLVRRNAYFNLTKLGANASEYYIDFYGDVDDMVNGGQGSDRLLARWELQGEPRPSFPQGAGRAVSVSADGRPNVADAGDAPAVLVQVPTDIEQMRADAPELAREWRLTIRDVLGGLIRAGGKIVGFTPEGSYHVMRGQR